jgi:hypothetical protein
MKKISNYYYYSDLRPKLLACMDRATSNFGLHMRIFNLQERGAPDKLKKKFAEINFPSHHSFLRQRKVKKIKWKSPHTKKTQRT